MVGVPTNLPWNKKVLKLKVLSMNNDSVADFSDNFIYSYIYRIIMVRDKTLNGKR